MPQAAKRPCNHPGCSELTNTKWCSNHNEQYDKWGHRKDEQRIYHTSEWKQLRRATLKRDIVCCICKCRASTDCDHIVPRGKGGKDELRNLQGLCKGCHDAKTIRERTNG